MQVIISSGCSGFCTQNKNMQIDKQQQQQPTTINIAIDSDIQENYFVAAAVSIVPEKRDAKMCATQRIRTSQKKQFIVCSKM